MKDQKKNYQEPVLNVIKMRSLPCLQDGSDGPPAEGGGGKDPYGEDPNGARQNDMFDD